MNSIFKTSLSLLAAASVLGIAALPAHAQQRFSARDTVLVSPEGDILDYVPDDGSVRAMRDNRGRTVYVDGWGNIVATAMQADRYFARGDDYRPRRDRYREMRGYPEANPDYFPPAPEADYGDELTTSSVPEMREGLPGSIERQPLPDADFGGSQALPDFSDDSAALPETGTDPDAEFVPGPKFHPAIAIGKVSSAEITALQVFLDREGFSPGVIDGKKGSNVTKAIEAWQQATGETLDPNNADDILERLRLSGGLAFTTYEITAADAAGPYVAAIPDDYAQKAALPHLSFTSTTEMLAEKFHMDEAYLKEINPGVDFTIPGTIIKVVDTGERKTGKVAKILADKGRKQVLAYDENGTLIAAYPASIGSADTPSPSGTVTVERIALNPGYTYNPKINFQQGNNNKVLTLQPGPNGPVGTVWIALSKPTYGIHGTPEPSKIGKTQSHGCIRLTNWDATELAKMTSAGVTVEFVD
ncbi:MULTISPECIES: L,D-transpeptidase [unclassified Shinella]|uniref:L,D-transpeptidase family protein n=1 Tax=unclassified Shinella TaxID=2643062 RepID=UPI00225CD9CC|nr:MULTISPECIES: L,D-transpeptidase [unclassified Shinella]MCO5138741.1 L,D-transpeptidase [Shinella sp.]MDC7255579.1 L,D-transpeptidase [Shinella sp. YE25]CAI0338385.1 Lipoprotein-anchoring transpeptidase ErfK/SrfK [Rhizobiaceae bacterium]CAK7256831.1 Lipoprotein-anchoring transpeptidase ErfK/SrfK [Shinella sp. WSC3-e]